MNIFDTSDFPPRWECGTWTGVHGWTHITADLLIFLSYLAIPISIAILIRKRRVPVPAIGWLFVAFIFSCGLVHLLEAVTFYWPVYRVSAIAKSVTAVVSVATVFGLLGVTPKLLTFPALASLNAKLHESQQSLAKRNEEMGRFVSIVSHDLRTPLVTISGFASNLRHCLAVGDTEGGLRSVARIESSVGSMEQLVRDILFQSRIQTEHDVERAAEVDLNEVVSEVIDDHADEIQARGFEVHTLARFPTVRGNPLEFERIFNNLIENAIRYGAGEGGNPSRIEIGCRTWTTDDEFFEFYVKDHGRGIDPAHHEKIFQMFERLETDPGGSGIGLASVVKTLEAYGGKIWVESEPGKGTTFFVRICQGGSEFESN